MAKALKFLLHACEMLRSHVKFNEVCPPQITPKLQTNETQVLVLDALLAVCLSAHITPMIQHIYTSPESLFFHTESHTKGKRRCKKKGGLKQRLQI